MLLSLMNALFAERCACVCAVHIHAAEQRLRLAGRYVRHGHDEVPLQARHDAVRVRGQHAVH